MANRERQIINKEPWVPSWWEDSGEPVYWWDDVSGQESQWQAPWEDNDKNGN